MPDFYIHAYDLNATDDNKVQGNLDPHKRWRGDDTRKEGKKKSNKNKKRRRKEEKVGVMTI